MEKLAVTILITVAEVTFKKFKCLGCASRIKSNSSHWMCTALLNRRPPKAVWHFWYARGLGKNEKAFSFSELRGTSGVGEGVRNSSKVMGLPTPDSDIDDLPQALPSPPQKKTV